MGGDYFFYCFFVICVCYGFNEGDGIYDVVFMYVGVFFFWYVGWCRDLSIFGWVGFYGGGI